MKSLTAKLKEFRDLMAGITRNFYHHRRPEWNSMRYKDAWIVWAEQSESDSLYLDNIKTDQVIRGTLDLYTRVDYDPRIDTIQERLNNSPITRWELTNVESEDETELTHYHWEWEM